MRDKQLQEIVQLEREIREIRASKWRWVRRIVLITLFVALIRILLGV